MQKVIPVLIIAVVVLVVIFFCIIIIIVIIIIIRLIQEKLVLTINIRSNLKGLNLSKIFIYGQEFLKYNTFLILINTSL